MTIRQVFFEFVIFVWAYKKGILTSCIYLSKGLQGEQHFVAYDGKKSTSNAFSAAFWACQHDRINFWYIQEEIVCVICHGLTSGANCGGVYNDEWYNFSALRFFYQVPFEFMGAHTLRNKIRECCWMIIKKHSLHPLTDIFFHNAMQTSAACKNFPGR